MEHRQEFSHNGILHIICEYAPPPLPKGKAEERIQKLLDRMALAVFKSAEEALPSLSEKYEKNPDPHKKLRHRPLLLSLRFDCEERKRFFLITHHLCLSRCGRTLSQKKGEVCFDKRSGYLLKKAKLDI
jgi:hypothetical protein